MDGDARSLLSFDDGFRLEGWTVVPRANELVRPGETAHVEPKPMEVLVYLAAHAGEAVPREALMAAVWPGVIVGDHALNRCVSQLRALFGDDARDPRVIETIPKVGYRLIAPVERLGDSAAAPLADVDVRVSAPSQPVAAPAPRPSRRRLGAVLAVLGLVVLVGVAFALRPQAEAPLTRPLTTAVGVENEAAWSPDGAHLAYVHRTDDGARHLYVRTLGTDAPLRLTDGEADSAPAWRPDGAAVAFVRCDSACGLYTVSPLGGAVRRLAEGAVHPRGGGWTADGRHFIVSAAGGADGRFAVTLLDLDTGARRRLTDPPEGAQDLAPRVSPDGTAILFARHTRAGGDLHRVPVAGGEATPLTSDGRALAGHAWTADGSAVVFSSNRTGVYALWHVPAGGGEPEAVVGPAVRDPGGPAVAAGRLAVEDWVFEINLWEHSQEGAPFRRVASTLWDKHPHLSPDGARLAFISNRTGPPEVWTANRDGSGLLRLTDFGGASVEHPRWSPDGRRLVFQARPDTQADLFVIDAQGGPPRRLTTAEADDVAPRWSRDGRAVYFGSNRSGAWQVWKVPAEGGGSAPLTPGAAVQVTQDGGYTAEEAPDGALLVARYEEAGLWRVADGEERRVTDLPAPGNWGNWAVTTRGVVVLDRQGDALRLVQLDPVTGQPEALPFAVRDVMHGEPGLTVSADGETVVAAQVDRIGADLLLVAPFE